MVTPIQHHPAILAVGTTPITQPPGLVAEFMGTLTRVEYGSAPDAHWRMDAPMEVTTTLPEFDEEYFEWVSLVEALAETRGEFTMIELGAGYGRWSVRGAVGARARGIGFRCVAVEAEPTHFRWLRQHLRDNGIDPDEHELVWAAVDAEGGFAPFRVGRARDYYGQKLELTATTPLPDARGRRRLRARAALGRPPALPIDHGRDRIWVPCVTLAGLLVPYPCVDLIDIDIQGAELQVVRAAIDQLDARVRRVHIGTHSPEAEDGLRELFREHAWEPIHDYPCHATMPTPYGEISFKDGVQTWLNPSTRRSRQVPAPKEATTLSVTASEIRNQRRRYAKVQKRNDSLLRRNARLERERREYYERMRRAEAVADELAREAAQARSRSRAAEQQRPEKSKGAQTSEADIERRHHGTKAQNAEIARLRNACDRLERKLSETYRSTSWRITAPVRLLARFFRRR